MPRSTPRMLFPFPAEGEDPFFEYFRQFTNDVDAAAFADADNNNLIGIGSALFAWDATSGVLSWDSDFHFTGFTSGFRVTISGPDAVTILPGQVLAFVMPRLLTANIDATPFVAARIAEADGVKIHDRIVICARDVDTIYFRNGVAIGDGESGRIWERPASGPSLPGMTAAQRAIINSALHTHTEYSFQPGVSGVVVGQTVLTLPNPAPETYRRFVVYRNGLRQRRGASLDYVEVLTTPFQVVLIQPLQSTSDVVVVETETSVTVPS